MKQSDRTNGLQLVFLLVSLILLVSTGWIGVRSDYRDAFKSSVREVTEQIDEYSGYAGLLLGSDFDTEDLKAVQGFIEKLEDGSLSPLEAGLMAPRLAKALQWFGSWVDDAEDLQKAQFWIWVYTVIFWLTVAAGVLTIVFSLVKRQSPIGVCYVGGLVILLIAFIVIWLEVDTDILTLTFWPFAAILFGVGAFVVHKRSAGRAVLQTGVAAEERWVCPVCESLENASSAFCSQCGAPKPEKASGTEEAAFCYNCGTKLEKGVLFCPNCGTKRDS